MPNELNLQGIPWELKNSPQWVVWRAKPKDNGRFDKIPVDPTTGRPAATNNPKTWGKFIEALKFYRKNKHNGASGVGFVFCDKDPFCGIDLDNCRDAQTGKVELWAQAYVDKLHSYTEITPSGRGLHILVRGHLPGAGRKKGKIEVYDRGRFFTITGGHLAGTPTTIEARQTELETFLRDVFGKEEEPKPPIETKCTLLSDEEILEKARAARNSAKFNKLWAGDHSDYPSPSEADLALCNELAFWCGNNPQQIDRLFRRSDLYRPKWDEKHGAKTYGEMTILKAIQNATEKFTLGGSLSEEIPIHETDLGNALRLVRLHGADIRYCHDWHRWLVWDGKRWKIDNQGRIRAKAKDTVLKIYRELRKISDKDARKRLFNHAMKSEADQKIKAMLSLAESEPEIPVTPEELDRDPWVLNCENGTLNLKTGLLAPHKKVDLITKICPVSYYKDAGCPKWIKFLSTIMDKNQELIEFIQRAVGYSLTGLTSEQCLFFLYGLGANGKSTFLETISTLLGDYAKQTEFSTFLIKYSEVIRNDLARLKGVRFVSAIEAAEGKRFAEGLLKQLTGQDRIAARFLRQEYFEFMPEFKIWLSANHRPPIVGTDHAIWRRIKVVPFTVTIPEKLQNPDLPAELKEELTGILAWAVEGCQAWQKIRLREPKEVKAATQKYKSDMDIIGDFLKDACEFDRDSEISKGELYKRYSGWCEETGEKKMSSKKFGMCLLDRCFEERREGQKRYWIGIK